MPDLDSPLNERTNTWRWSVCGLLLLATMLNYMDRQTLSLTITDISNELELSNEQYGAMEFGFGIAFAAGAIVMGILADKISVFWLYPLVLIGWSLSGMATAYGAEIGRFMVETLGSWIPAATPGHSESHAGYVGLMTCRTLLGFFEAGQWPCALVTTQRILSQRERTFGNSLLQSGASVGAILTPIIVQSLVTSEPGSWRAPFLIIGGIGMLWIIPWMLLVRRRDLEIRRVPSAAEESADTAVGDTTARTVDATVAGSKQASPAREVLPELRGSAFALRFLVLIVVVVAINLTWHYFRAWLPKLLREYHGYERSTVNYFTSAYYISTDVGCIAAGFAVRWLSKYRWGVHGARVATFAFCAMLTALSTVASYLPASPLLLGLLLLIGFGSLGLFPIYYSLTQELSARHQGKVTGTLSAITWVITSEMQYLVGRNIDATGSYATGIFAVGLAPLIALAVLWLFWPPQKENAAAP
jgi:MFS transporter, ACS family, hexuronate transporter